MKEISNKYNNRYHDLLVKEREKYYRKILTERYDTLSSLRMLEIGAGYGGNLVFFHKIGFIPMNLYANEILPGRSEVIQSKVPGINIYAGDALKLDEQELAPFDIVFQSTVFTSLLDNVLKQKMAGKMWKLLKSGGIVLWYDFMYDNPKNKKVKAVKKAEIPGLFPGNKSIDFHKVTLAPPLGRTFPILYHFLNSLPALRTHLIAVIEKP